MSGKDHMLGDFTLQQAERVIAERFKHTLKCHELNASTLEHLERDLRTALELKLDNKGYNYPPDVILYVIDHLVCWHTGRGSVYEW